MAKTWAKDRVGGKISQTPTEDASWTRIVLGFCTAGRYKLKSRLMNSEESKTATENHPLLRVIGGIVEASVAREQGCSLFSPPCRANRAGFEPHVA